MTSARQILRWKLKCGLARGANDLHAIPQGHVRQANQSAAAASSKQRYCIALRARGHQFHPAVSVREIILRLEIVRLKEFPSARQAICLRLTTPSIPRDRARSPNALRR